MHSLPSFLADLSLILIVAGTISLVLSRLQLPVVLGYLLAGFAVGPHFEFLPTIKDQINLKVWSELGLIFLLFGLGLKFRVSDLMKSQKHGRTAFLQFMLTFACVYGVAQLLRLPPQWVLFLATGFAITSTSLVVKTFEELQLTQRHSSQLVFKTLIFEDVLALFAIVLLSGVSGAEGFAGGDVLALAFRFLIFLFGFLIFGLFLVPQLVKFLKPPTGQAIGQEVLLLVSLGLCFLYVRLSSQLGFSSAFGAFLMGAILAETSLQKPIEKLLFPLRALFLAVFFVSIGMMIEPRIFLKYPVALVLCSGALIFGKIVGNFMGHLLNGEKNQDALSASFPMIQIGEFTLLIAGLSQGQSQGQEGSSDLTSFMVGAVMISASLGPLLVRQEKDLNFYLQKQTWFQKLVAHFASPSSNLAPTSIAGASAILFFVPVSILVLFSLLYESVLQWILTHLQLKHPLILVGTWAVHLAVCLVFLTALVEALSDASRVLSKQWARKVSLLFVCLFFFVLQSLSYPPWLALAGVLSLVALFFGGGWNFFLGGYQALSNYFLSQLPKPEGRPSFFEKTPWESHISEIPVEEDSSLVGLKLQDLRKFIEKNLLVTHIQRGSQVLVSPGGEEVFFPMDVLGALGEDDSLQRLELLAKTRPPMDADASSPELHSFMLNPGHAFVGKSLGELNLRQSHRILVVGVERAGEKFPSPGANFILEPQDRIWVVGNNPSLF